MSVNTTPSAEQILLAAESIDLLLVHIRSLIWAAGSAADHEGLDCMQSLMLADLPVIFKSLDDVGVSLGNIRHGNFD